MPASSMIFENNSLDTNFFENRLVPHSVLYFLQYFKVLSCRSNSSDKDASGWKINFENMSEVVTGKELAGLEAILKGSA